MEEDSRDIKSDATASEILDAAIEELAATPRLLLVCDFDGTIAPIVAHPDMATLDPRALIALRQLSELPLTWVAILSGRALEDLSAKLSALDRVRLVGSHGSEFDVGTASPLDSAGRELLEFAERGVDELIARVPGAWLERKPHAIALHTRGVAPELATETEEAVFDTWSRIGAGQIRRGKCVVEFSAITTNKGNALNKLRFDISPTAVFFAGDDGTDEDAFREIGSNGWTCKVGPEDTLARFRIPTVDGFVSFLVRLAERRKQLLAAFPIDAITSHALLSDMRTFALANTDGNIVWMCFPRLDSAPIFGRLVGGPEGGHFHIAPVASEKATVTYERDSMVLRTTWSSLSLIDFLDVGFNRAWQRPGRTDLVRILSGSGDVRLTFSPRLDFGQLATTLEIVEGGVRVLGGPLPIVLFAPQWEWSIETSGTHQTAHGRRTLADETCVIELRLGTGSLEPATATPDRRLQATFAFWRAWVQGLTLPEKRRDTILRSAITLRALTYGPSGAISAAATTSLPEEIGGIRNWDYRFCWPRDASLAATALCRLGDTITGIRLLDWIVGILEQAHPEEFLAPVYTVHGRHLSGEAEVPAALGYRGSRPVRIGNLAAAQLQLDAIGPVIELVASLARGGAALSAEHFGIVCRLVTQIENRWQEPDHGIWEVRGSRQHFVHSKLMCWYAVENAIAVARYLDAGTRTWPQLARALREEIENRGYSVKTGTYIAAYDLEAPDAALAWLVLTGFHPPDDLRLQRTMHWLYESLREQQWVYRYRMNDGLTGNEGAFLLCSAWFAEAFAILGEMDLARDLVLGLETAMGPLGLLSEEWGVTDRLPLGNFPQAFSHLGYINAVFAIERSG